ncbi:MAG TPA: thiamine phosphate synthase, partial [Byssovorax sp.]
EVPLFANDRADLAQLAGATGVHVGQEDLPPELARAVDPGLRVGISTHDDAELDAVLDAAPGYVDYVAIGPIYETRNKERPSHVVGVDALAARAARARAARPTLPVVAIGGVDAARIAAVAPLVDAVAIIGALLPAATGADPYELATAQARDLVARISAAQAGARP